MFNANLMKEARKIYERAVNRYNGIYAQVQASGQTLYDERRQCLDLIQDVETFINTIANQPKEFEVALTSIGVERGKFKATEEFAREAAKTAAHSGAGVAAGVAGGAAVAALAPSAAMWVATTFGTASTGTAISSLSGAVATKAALAWLGGGALTAGGAGVAGGQALLALAGPIGWGIAGVTATTSMAIMSSKNKKMAREAMDAARTVTEAGAGLDKTNAAIVYLLKETKALRNSLRQAASHAEGMRGANFLQLSEEQQLELGALVNNTLSLAQMLNRTVGE